MTTEYKVVNEHLEHTESFKLLLNRLSDFCKPIVETIEVWCQVNDVTIEQAALALDEAIKVVASEIDLTTTLYHIEEGKK